jgi:hypothetical protein
MQLEGFAYRLVPIKSKSIGRYEAGRIEVDRLYDNLMNKFRWGRMNEPDVYLDDFHVRTTSVIRLRTRFVQLANTLIELGDTTRALQALDRVVEITPHEKIPYDHTIIQIANGYYRCKKTDQGNELVNRLTVIGNEKLAYYLDQNPRFIASINNEILYQFQIMQNLINLCNTFDQKALNDSISGISTRHYTTYTNILNGL